MKVTYVYRPNGLPGVLAKCGCGWADYWTIVDGSAQESGAAHECGKPSAVSPRPLPKVQSDPAVKYPDDYEADSCTCFIFAPCGWCENQWEGETND